jgi:hypothetical protein
MRQVPLWIVEPPLSTGERMSVNDPLQTSRSTRNGRRKLRKPTLNSGTAGASVTGGTAIAVTAGRTDEFGASTPK